MLPLIIVLFSCCYSTFGQEQLLQEQSCGHEYQVCSPKGATAQSLPEVGPPLANLYPDLLSTVEAGGGPALAAGGPVKRQSELVSFCCAPGSRCLLLASYSIAFCWDRFTTNFVFPDGSAGSIAAGNFTSSTGTKLDLVYGSYEASDGSTGNIYQGGFQTGLNISTMVVPTPFTSSGIGSAIPISKLGTMSRITSVTITEDRPEATLTAITLPSLTISVGSTSCTRCIGVTSPPTISGGNATSSGRPSVIFPPITNGWPHSNAIWQQTSILVVAIANLVIQSI